MTTSDERRLTGREIQGQLWPAILKGLGDQFPAAKLAPDYFDHVQQRASGDIWSRPQDVHLPQLYGPAPLPEFVRHKLLALALGSMR